MNIQSSNLFTSLAVQLSQYTQELEQRTNEKEQLQALLKRLKAGPFAFDALTITKLIPA